MTRIERLVLLLASLGGCCAGQCSAQVARLELADGGKASAVCIGESEPSTALWVTAGHNFRECSQATVIWKGQRYPIENLVVAQDVDLAHFQCIAPAEAMPLYAGDPVPQGTLVDVAGYGPEYFGRATGARVREARLESLDTLEQISEQVVPGDSGGVVAHNRRTFGIINGFETESPRRTVWTPAVKIHECLSRVYDVQCPPGGCPIYIRRGVRQPMIGIPVGPPQLVTDISPNPPQKYVPAPTPDPISVQGPRGEKGDRGPQGERGPTGPPGESVSKEHVEAVVTAWLSANMDQLRGEPGPAGSPGRDGKSFTSEELRVAAAVWLEANRLDLRSPPPSDTQVTKAVADILFADPERFRGPPGKDGSPGSAGPKGDRYVAVPDDEAFKQHVDRWLNANPQYKDLPGLSKRLDEIESLLSKKQPVQILNSDGTVFSEDVDRGILDPIVIRLEDPK